MSLPLQHEMDMGDPEQHVVWALLNMGSGMNAPMLLPTPVLKEWSRHLYRCGFRHHPECQEIFYQPPRQDASVLEAGAGQWVEAETPGVSPLSNHDEVDELIDGLPDEVIERILKRRGEQ